MATFKVTNIIRIRSKVSYDVSFKPYRQNFNFILVGGDTIELRTDEPEKSLYYYKSILPYADVEMIDEFDKEFYTITVNVAHSEHSGDEQIAFGGTATVTISPLTGYEFPQEGFSIEGADPTIDGGTITLSNPTEDVVISGACIAIEYSITYNIENGQCAANDPVSVQYGQTVAIHIVPDEGYGYPVTVDGVSVTNATKGNYTAQNASVELEITPNGEGDISVSCSCFDFNIDFETPESTEVSVGGKMSSDLQVGLTHGDEGFTGGTLKYVSGYTAFTTQQQGHYIMVTPSATTFDGVSTILDVYVKYHEDPDNVSAYWEKISDSGNYVQYIDTVTDQTLCIKATIGEQYYIHEYSLDSLTLEQEPTPPQQP